ncbi:MAG: pilus assembly protein PilZ [Methylobacter sp.]|nr:MAG: pilus assembly protein PilZ [Methylobacter sp.]PPD23802.1 MAG: pilus assembly protein PilZ [Methylobacter sp.]PPD34412.1 MAG: pilus assembly protein PilZ [Methylomonas sp.]
MLEYDEKRNYIRMEVDCDITYKYAGAELTNFGRCTSISGAGVSFVAEQAIEPGTAMEIHIVPKNSITPPMTAYIEVVRCTPQDNYFDVAATIKSIKGE